MSAARDEVERIAEIRPTLDAFWDELRWPRPEGADDGWWLSDSAIRRYRPVLEMTVLPLLNERDALRDEVRRLTENLDLEAQIALSETHA